MNLSALNKLPANSLGISNTEASAPDNALSRLSSTAFSGGDFASFLHSQVQALNAPQRQDPAADHGKLPQQRTDRTVAGNDKPENKVSAKSGKSTKQAQADKQTQHPVHRDETTSTEKLSAQDTVNGQLVDPLLQTALTGTNEDKPPGSDMNKPQAALSDQADNLTTIAVSDSLQIITAAQAAPSEKSVADFALAMGLDPGQVKELFGSSSASAANATMKPGLSTKDMLGLNTMPAYTPANAFANSPDSASAVSQAAVLNTPVSSADFQALQQTAPATETKPDADMLAKLDNLQIQLGTAQAQQIAVAPPPSTLSVLSMMDAQLRAEDIESLKNEFDALQAVPSSDVSGLNLSGGASAQGQRTGHNLSTPAATVFANNPDMAQTYENLSQKLTTELAARMHEKLNAGEWKMKFALKPASLGLVDVQLEMRDGKLTAQFQSDTALTQDLIQNGSQRLKDALADLGLNNASVLVGQGQSQSAGQSGQGSPQGQTGLPAKREENRAKLTDQPGPKIAEDSGPRRSKRSQFDSYA